MSLLVVMVTPRRHVVTRSPPPSPTQGYPHDFTACPYLHPGERARRRDPRSFTYSAALCPDVKKVRSRLPQRASWCVSIVSAQSAAAFTMPVCLNTAVACSCLLMQTHVQDKVCVRGMACLYSHNIFEVREGWSLVGGAAS